jgi:hypothetical protein
VPPQPGGRGLVPRASAVARSTLPVPNCAAGSTATVPGWHRRFIVWKWDCTARRIGRRCIRTAIKALTGQVNDVFDAVEFGHDGLVGQTAVQIVNHLDNSF